MDTSKFKRRVIQTPRQNPYQPLGYRPIVTSGDGLRPRVRPLAPVAAAPSAPSQAAPLAVSPQVAPVPTVAQAAPVQPVAPPRRSPLDMSLPGEASPSRLNAFIYNPKWRRLRSWTFRTAAIAMVLLITMGGLIFSQSYLKLHKVFRGSTGTAAALKENVRPELLKGEGAGRVNILLLGRGGAEHDGADLTDSMMIASVDPVNHTAALLSVPRDLWVKVPGGGSMKINAAWETGEFNYLHQIKPGSTDPKAIAAANDSVDGVIKETLGLDINYHVVLDFQAFRQAIDTVGGVDVNVPADLVDPTMAWENDRNPVLAKAGLDTMDGRHALIYVRSRETSSDFARAQRQRSVLLALKNKTESLGIISNPVKLAGLFNAFGNNVSTDLSLNNVTRLYSLLKGVKPGSITSVGLGDQNNNLVTTASISGQSVVLPKAGAADFDEIKAYVRSQLQDPYIKKEHAKIMVLNGTLTPGVASKTGDTLKSYGYNVVSVGNTPTSGWTQTTLIDLTHRNKYTKNYLEQRYGVTAADSLSDKTINTTGADFAIIIGSDEATPAHP